MHKRFFIFFLIFLNFTLIAQDNIKIVPIIRNDEIKNPTPYDLNSIPNPILDLRRFEVVMFGVLPMAFFISGLVTDIALYAKYKTEDYIPLFGSATLNNNEVAYTIGLSFAISFIVATADMIIVKEKNRAKELTKVKKERRKISSELSNKIDEDFVAQEPNKLSEEKRDGE